jgi:hypothetical protein
MTNYNLSHQEELIANIPTVEKCEKYLANVVRLEVEELVPMVNRRMVEIRNQESQIHSAHERDVAQPIIVEKLGVCLAAYEQTLKNKYAGRIRPQIDTRGFIETVDSIVQKKTRGEGFQKLQGLGLEEFLFEHVVVENPQVFSEEAVDKSVRRLAELN